MAMGAPSDEDMVSLLSQFELLHKSFKDAVLDIRTLKAKLSLETQKREAAETFSHSIEQERQRLLKAQGETLSKMVQQLEFRSNFEDMLKDLNSLKLQLASREKEHEKLLSAIREENAAEVSALQNQIRQSQEELTLRDAAVAHLEQELSCLHSTMKELHQSSEKAHQDEALKYQLEICDMKHKLQLLAQEKNMLENGLLQEKNMLQEQLWSVEKQFMTERADYEKKLRESSFNRHAEVYKQKIMRLRKENEDLRLQLLGAAHH